MTERDKTFFKKKEALNNLRKAWDDAIKAGIMFYDFYEGYPITKLDDLSVKCNFKENEKC